MVVRGDPPLLPCLLPPPTHASATPPSVVGGQTGAAPSELRLSVIILSGGDGYEGRAQKAAHTQPAAVSDGALVFHTHTHTHAHTHTHTVPPHRVFINSWIWIFSGLRWGNAHSVLWERDRVNDVRKRQERRQYRHIERKLYRETQQDIVQSRVD